MDLTCINISVISNQSAHAWVPILGGGLKGTVLLHFWTGGHNTTSHPPTFDQKINYQNDPQIPS